ncbi:hypothetical protein PG985_005835 [Apiospora marii]|uniref:uncharacterized protein n=1 Tax=Apiospora marii TaxID=335849 RepID=UPI003130C6BA
MAQPNTASLGEQIKAKKHASYDGAIQVEEQGKDAYCVKQLAHDQLRRQCVREREAGMGLGLVLHHDERYNWLAAVSTLIDLTPAADTIASLASSSREGIFQHSTSYCGSSSAMDSFIMTARGATAETNQTARRRPLQDPAPFKETAKHLDSYRRLCGVIPDLTSRY